MQVDLLVHAHQAIIRWEGSGSATVAISSAYRRVARSLRFSSVSSAARRLPVTSGWAGQPAPSRGGEFAPCQGPGSGHSSNDTRTCT
jgi:hypothetical protein